MRAVLIGDRYSRSDRLVKMLGQIPDIEIVAQSKISGDAPELCTVHMPDLLLMDVSAKDDGVLEHAAHIKRDFPDIKVFVMTDAKDDGLALKAKEAGADIIARKNLSLDEFRQLIRYSQKHYRVFPSARPEPQEPP